MAFVGYQRLPIGAIARKYGTSVRLRQFDGARPIDLPTEDLDAMQEDINSLCGSVERQRNELRHFAYFQEITQRASQEQIQQLEEIFEELGFIPEQLRLLARRREEEEGEVLQSLRRDCQDAEDEASKLRETKADLDVQLEEKTSEVAKLRQENLAVQQENSKVKQEHSMLKQESTRLRAELAAARSRISVLERIEVQVTVRSAAEDAGVVEERLEEDATQAEANLGRILTLERTVANLREMYLVLTARYVRAQNRIERLVHAYTVLQLATRVRLGHFAERAEGQVQRIEGWLGDFAGRAEEQVQRIEGFVRQLFP